MKTVLKAFLFMALSLFCSCGNGEVLHRLTKEGRKDPTGGETADIAEKSAFCYVKDGVLRARDGSVFTAWGVNFQTPLSWEVNRLAKVGVAKTAADLKKVTDNNLDDIVLMGANGIRCHLTPADYTDSKGNLQQTAFLESLDYLVAKAEEKGVYVTLALLNHMGQKGPGSDWTGKGSRTWIHDKSVVECTRNYVSQFLDHVNPYSGKAYKDAPNIAFWELINEPEMFSYSELDTSGYKGDFDAWSEAGGKASDSTSYAEYRTVLVQGYIDSMVELIRSKGDSHPVCWGLNWHRFRRDNADIFKGVADSKADLVAFCNYPGQDYVSSDYWNNTYDFTQRSFTDWFQKYFKDVDGYGWALTDEFASKGKVVYEFETFFNQSAYLYPTQAAYFRNLGAQCASMWTYTFSELAPYFGGSHFLNLRCTPGKAASFMVGAHIFASTPLHTLTTVNDEMSGPGWAISKKHNAAVYSDSEWFITSGETASGWSGIIPSDKVKHIHGIGNSPIVKYSGTGIYFIDETSEGLEINLMPDVKVVGNRFSSPDYSSIVTELSYDSINTMSILLGSWKSADCIMYSIEGSTRKDFGTVHGTASLSLAPGKYILIKK